MTVIHQTQYVAFTNRTLGDRWQRFAVLEVRKLRGQRMPALPAKISLGVIVGHYRYVHPLGGAMLVPVDFLQQTVCWPTNSILTNASTRLWHAGPALEEVLVYNGIVGIREGPAVRLVKKEWVQTNSVTNPHSGFDRSTSGLSQ